MIDWKLIQGKLPGLVETLGQVMSTDGIGSIVALDDSEVEIVPSVKITYSLPSGDRVRLCLSIEINPDEEADPDTDGPPCPA